MSEWDDLSDWYDKKQGEDGDLWHRALIDPVLLRLVGDPRDRDILDLGSGNGTSRGDSPGRVAGSRQSTLRSE
ncbi:MAG: hypothetical protein OK474_08015 [Thaumarchaeota archaeon]|nr:hypothetical protein [Nitrososphaerota archaeon]